MDDLDLLYRLGSALAIGLLIGAERHWQERDQERGQRTAGVRTFALIGLFGGVSAALAQSVGVEQGWSAPLLGFALLAFSLPFAFFKWKEAEAEGSFSVTTVVAGELAFVLGAFVVLGAVQVAAATAVAMTTLLASRELLHGFVKRVTWRELRATLLLLSMSLVALPLLPDQPIEEIGGLNPARIWLLAVVLAAVSFIGYVAVKLLGDRSGRILAGAAGGLVSSTATTIANAREARRRSTHHVLAAGTLAANAVSFLRTGAIVWAASADPMLPLLAALLAGALVFSAGTLILARRAESDVRRAEAPANPFDLWSVVQLSLLLAMVELAGKHAAKFFGQAGAFAVAALSGLADVDPVTLGMTRLVPGDLSAEDASIAIGIAVASNTLAKSTYALALGGGVFARIVTGASLLALGAGGIVLALLQNA